MLVVNTLLVLGVVLSILRLVFSWRLSSYGANTVGFLHASSGSGGGGERVLWTAVKGLQETDAKRGVERRYIVFTNPYRIEGRTKRGEEDLHLLELIQKQFNIRLIRPVEFVYLRSSITQWTKTEKYCWLALFLEIFFGGFLLFYEAAVANKMTPIVFETVGCPFTYPLIRLLVGSRVISYTHYPMISSAMKQRVKKDRGVTKRQLFRCSAKVWYYNALAASLEMMGLCANVVLTNSKWTQQHVEKLYWPKKCPVLYPPCNVEQFTEMRRAPKDRVNNIVSVGQFRPEKNHQLQLMAFFRAQRYLPPDAKLIMIGGVRNSDDENRARDIQLQAEKLGISDRVDIRTSASVRDIVAELGRCAVGLHTMMDEHFGIVMLEYMAAGCIPLGHRSGGVQMDIITSPKLGFLATTEEEYSRAIVEICQMRINTPEKYAEMQKNMDGYAKTFDDDSFTLDFVALLSPILY